MEAVNRFFGDYLRFEFAPGGDEGRAVFKMIIKDGRLWVDSKFLYLDNGVTVDGIIIPNQIARQVLKMVFPLSKWDVEQRQSLMMDGPSLEVHYSDWDGRGVWLCASSFNYEAAWEMVRKAYELCHRAEIDQLRGTLLFQKTEMNKEGSMELQTICNEVLAIEEGLMYGTIPFAYDNLMSALKPGHPMEILDEILSEIFWDVQAGKEPSLEALKSTLNNFKEFRMVFKVQNMSAPIRHLAAYIKTREKEDMDSEL